jgi:hypothetical protein
LYLHGNGTTSNKDAIGARVILESNSSVQSAEVSRGNGFASQSDPRVRFGLGQDATIKSVRILWPDGKEETLSDVKTETYHEITESN